MDIRRRNTKKLSSEEWVKNIEEATGVFNKHRNLRNTVSNKPSPVHNSVQNTRTLDILHGVIKV